MATRAAKAEYTSKMLGREIELEYSKTWIGYTLVSLRVIMGWVFLQAGLGKVFAAESWTAAGYLANGISEGNPFMGMWSSFAGSPLIDGMNMYGQTLIGLTLILGLMVRWSAFWGALMFLFYWASSLQGGLLQGFPLEHGYFVDNHMVYAFILFGLGAFGAGRIIGIDRKLKVSGIVKNNRFLTYILG